MMLYANGQDIAHIVLGLVGDDGAWAVAPTGIPATPEAALGAIDAFLREHDVSRTGLAALAVVRGPGSPTALRTTLAIMNAWAFAGGLHIRGIEKRPDEVDADMLERVNAAHPVPMTLPLYTALPHITSSTKDALGRTS